MEAYGDRASALSVRSCCVSTLCLVVLCRYLCTSDNLGSQKYDSIRIRKPRKPCLESWFLSMFRCFVILQIEGRLIRASELNSLNGRLLASPWARFSLPRSSRGWVSGGDPVSFCQFAEVVAVGRDSSSGIPFGCVCCRATPKRLCTGHWSLWCWLAQIYHSSDNHSVSKRTPQYSKTNTTWRTWRLFKLDFFSQISNRVKSFRCTLFGLEGILL